MKSTASSQAQITEPAELRERPDLAPASSDILELREDGLPLRKGVRAKHPVDRLYGSLRLDRDVDELIGAMRGT